MRSGFIAVVLSMGLFAVGCGTEPEATGEEPVSSTEQGLNACGPGGTCGAGYTCAGSTCRPMCDPNGSCASPWTICCLGGFNSNGTVTQPYCTNSVSDCKWGRLTPTPGGEM